MTPSPRLIDASNARCTVFTFKEGLLATVAHDLRIRVLRFSIEADIRHGTVVARFDPRTLRVDCALRDGVESPGALSSRDLAEIERIIQDQVLHTSRFPEIALTSGTLSEAPDGWIVSGKLSLHGNLRPITARVVRNGNALSTEVRLHQPDFGIQPFTALLGTLKLKPDVVVKIETT